MSVTEGSTLTLRFRQSREIRALTPERKALILKRGGDATSNAGPTNSGEKSIESPLATGKGAGIASHLAPPMATVRRAFLSAEVIEWLRLNGDERDVLQEKRLR
ncbi:hypothetical protein LIA77_09297 [Sarocladium implicatum]|jgi:hypothetical protein|nr:hypothetical protein LIA77_09297 [Sarocladium implicatum]